MTECAFCQSTIIFGGKRDGNLTFCNDRCLEMGIGARLAIRLPDDIVEKRVAEVHEGKCPRCGGPGPVDAHVSYRVLSVLIHTTWSSRPQVSCHFCGVKSRLADAIYCLLFGWWGIPWGIIVTPIQILRNFAGAFSTADSSRPSDLLKSMIRADLAREIVAEQEVEDSLHRPSQAPVARYRRVYEPSPLVRFGFGLAGVLFVIGAPISGYFLTKIFFEARASDSWPTAPGVLSRAEVVRASSGRFRAAVAYSYQVGGVNFVGSRIRTMDGEYDNRRGAAQDIQGLVVGQVVSVFYNSANPQQSVLHSGAGYLEYMLLFVPLVMLAVGIALLWRARSSRPHS